MHVLRQRNQSYWSRRDVQETSTSFAYVWVLKTPSRSKCEDGKFQSYRPKIWLRNIDQDIYVTLRKKPITDKHIII